MFCCAETTTETLFFINIAFNGRKQRVVINGVSSSWGNVISGVPQGYVLGPLLFLIYINDIDTDLFSKLCKFADDTKIGRAVATEDEVQVLRDDFF